MRHGIVEDPVHPPCWIPSPRGRGLEAALAAALGDDLQASLARRAPVVLVRRPGDRTCLAAGRHAPGAGGLGAAVNWPPRLALTALVDKADGPAHPGDAATRRAAGVREGDLCGWDGFTVTADAPRPAQVRLEQISRLAELEAELARARTAPGGRQASQGGRRPHACRR